MAFNSSRKESIQYFIDFVASAAVKRPNAELPAARQAHKSKWHSIQAEKIYPIFHRHRSLHRSETTQRLPVARRLIRANGIQFKPKRICPIFHRLRNLRRSGTTQRRTSSRSSSCTAAKRPNAELSVARQAAPQRNDPTQNFQSLGFT